MEMRPYFLQRESPRAGAHRPDDPGRHAKSSDNT